MADFGSSFPLLMPSLLAADHACVWESLRPLLVAGGPQWLHFDVMDGHFVPNLSFGPQLLRDLRRKMEQDVLPRPRFDVHLMLSSPGEFIGMFADAGADSISIHGEVGDGVPALLEEIRRRGILCGLALNPGTPVELAFPLLHRVDLLLFMAVQPGFGGQFFQPAVISKMKTAWHFRKENRLSFRIEVDGGINLKTIPPAVASGAEILVAGNAIFGEEDPAAAFSRLLREAKIAASAPVAKTWPRQ